MNTPLLLGMTAGLLALAVPRGAAVEDATAYSALRIMGKSLGDETITRVVEVTGRVGKPQPPSWKIVILDGAKKAREVTVAGGQVVSQKSVASASLKQIHLTDLNLDSSGAFDAADKEARKARVPFTAIDYALRVSATTGKPVWNLELYNAERVRVGEVRLAAHDGNLLAVSGLTPTQQTTTVRTLNSASNNDHDTVRPTRVSPSGRGTTTTTTTTTYNNVRPAPPRGNGDDDGDDARRGSTSSSGWGRILFARRADARPHHRSGRRHLQSHRRGHRPNDATHRRENPAVLQRGRYRQRPGQRLIPRRRRSATW